MTELEFLLAISYLIFYRLLFKMMRNSENSPMEILLFPCQVIFVKIWDKMYFLFAITFKEVMFTTG